MGLERKSPDPIFGHFSTFSRKNIFKMSTNGKDGKMETRGDEITIIDDEGGNNSRPVSGPSAVAAKSKAAKKKPVVANKNAANKNDKKEKTKKSDKTPDQMRTFRFNLTLNTKKHKDKNNNDDNCFNWLQLVAQEEKQRVKDKKKKKKKKKKFEKKKKKKKKKKK